MHFPVLRFIYLVFGTLLILYLVLLRINAFKTGSKSKFGIDTARSIAQIASEQQQQQQQEQQQQQQRRQLLTIENTSLTQFKQSGIKTWRNSSMKTILYYTKFFGKTTWSFGEGQEGFITHKCPVNNCRLTSDRSALPSLGDFDALLFNYYEKDIAVQSGGSLRPNIPNPSSRGPHQRYVIHMFDPPPYCFVPFEPEEFNGIFNWTMSYRLDSDFPRPYGWFESLEQKKRVTAPSYKEFPYKWAEFDDSWIREDMKNSTTSSMKKLLDRKRKLVMVVSHCPVQSQRRKYAYELQKYVDVAIVGRCGDESCNPDVTNNPKDKSSIGKCQTFAKGNFKYFLAFENSLCDYYSSEKFWKHPFQGGMIPIVMGRGHYSDVAPPHSYIDVSDYESPKALAEYINYLEANPMEYLSYFWWRKYYRVSANQKTYDRGTEQAWVAICDLCEKLHNPEEPYKVFNGMKEMTECEEPPDWTGQI